MRVTEWLSFVPDVRGSLPPIVKSWDPVDRLIEFVPPSGAYDPRHFLAGTTVSDPESGVELWLSGFFDQNSFVETLSGWARTVVVGRARLGGIPMGVIAVETRTVEATVPADPANADSQEQVDVEAGQVWYPNSAFKTAQAINDFNKGEQLPLIIFANWRGFSGGQRDMYNEILKYGSYIVDALTKYRQPVFVYIIPNGELRGGAWVVLDPTINSDMMEMYADSASRAGVLEPEGIVEIKYRKPQILATMERLDESYRKLKAELCAGGKTAEETAKLKRQLEERESRLLPVYQQIAVHFADLHDTAGRMHAKGAVLRVLEWRSSRRFFYHRVRRRLLEEQLHREIAAACPAAGRSAAAAFIKSWYLEDKGAVPDDFASSDAEVADWLAADPPRHRSRVARLRDEGLVRTVCSVAKLSPDAFSSGLAAALSKMPVAAREALVRKLRALE
ncbi:MAG: ClpP/crotonase-like domain-containing protein [Olpidium bornovanus]|uniref:ClpP/crotonase-like domain-containing protein n=1 Tax=Olpidium bornovanus TaxID=278681 RepID=A0A8H8DKN2_9FUNG|nr:MAG: ClpP/crotonase-like domain-containing protein [Olpidium bornovanus]